MSNFACRKYILLGVNDPPPGGGCFIRFQCGAELCHRTYVMHAGQLKWWIDSDAEVDS